LNLFYTDSCPDSYEPHGFTRCIDEDLYFPSDHSITRKSTKSSRFLAGAYRAGVVVSHVDATDDRYTLRTIPQVMQYCTKRSRLDEYTASNEVSISHHATPDSHSLPLPSQPLVAAALMASQAAPSSPTGDDIRTKEALQRMQRSSSRPQGLLPTQSLVGADAMIAGGGGAAEDSCDDDTDTGASFGSGANGGAVAVNFGGCGAAAVAGSGVAAAGPAQARRKMSQSELVAFDLSTSEVDVEMGDGDEVDDEDEDDLYN
jgi:hypothetical protein